MGTVMLQRMATRLDVILRGRPQPPLTAVVIGAYHRLRYPPTREDWLEGKDFRLLFGSYFSIRDCDYLDQMGWQVLQFEWKAPGQSEGKVYFKYDLRSRQFID
jgi:hypothetical protein